MNLGHAQLETILKINGLNLKSPRDQIDALLVKAGYSPEDITNALASEAPSTADALSQTSQPLSSDTAAGMSAKKSSTFLRILITIIVTVLLLPVFVIASAFILAGLNAQRIKNAPASTSSVTSSTPSSATTQNSGSTATSVPGKPQVLNVTLPQGWIKSVLGVSAAYSTQGFFTPDKAAQAELNISPTNGRSLAERQQSESSYDAFQAQQVTVSGTPALRTSFDRKIGNQVVHNEELQFTVN